jgi:hypothetical protein
MRYYGWARNTERGEIGLLLVLRADGRKVSETWTGRYWPDTPGGFEDAEKHIEKLNAGIWRDRCASVAS